MESQVPIRYEDLYMIHPHWCWIDIGEGCKIAPDVEFIPHEGKKIKIGKNCIIDSGAKIYGGTTIGDNCIIGHYTIIRFNCKINHHTTIGNLCMLEGNIKIGHDTLIHTQNHIGQKTTIGNFVFVAPMCVFTNDPKMLYKRWEKTDWSQLCGPTIEDGVRVAVGVLVFPKIRIGKHAVLGMGAVVTKDVEPYTVVLGVPATPVKTIKPEEDKIYGEEK